MEYMEKEGMKSGEIDSEENEEMKTDLSYSEELLETRRESYESVVNGGILLDHLRSLRHGLRFIRLLFYIGHGVPDARIWDLVLHVKQTLNSNSHLMESYESLDCEYSVLREEMKNFIINPGTNTYQLIFPGWFSCDAYKETSLLLCEIIEELLSSDYKAHQISPVMKELEDIRTMLSFVKLFVEPCWDKQFAAVMGRVTCFVYLSAVGKMDDEVIRSSLKNISSDLTIEETQIMNMYIRLDVGSTENLESHISMSLRLLGWNKRCYLGTELGEALKDHFTCIEHGLQYLLKIIKVSENEDLKLRVLHLIYNVKRKLYSLAHSQNDENLKLNLEHAYGKLREEMKSVVINPGTNDYDTLFPKLSRADKCLLLEEIMELTLLKVNSSCETDQIASVIEEIKKFRKKLRSLEPLFYYEKIKFYFLFCVTWESEEKKVNVALTAFLDRATCLTYLSLVGNLNEEMLVSLKKNFSLLIEETEIEKISLNSGLISEDDFGADIDISLSLMKRHQEYHIYTINEAMLEDHIISLKQGNFDEDLKRCIILLDGNVKQTLESLTYKQGDQSLNMDVNGECVVLREEIKNVITQQGVDKYESLFPEPNFYDFLVEKITTLVTSNCRAGRIAPMKKDLQELQKRLTNFKPLGLYICGIPKSSSRSLYMWGEEILKTLLTFLHKATFLIYLTFVGTMDIEMVLSVKSSISAAIKETDDVQGIYTLILNQFLYEGDYKLKELYLLENLMNLLKNNDEYLDDENCKLHKVLITIHSFLLAQPPNVIRRKLHLLKELFEDILRHSIPIVYSFYLEVTEVDISAEFNYVLDLIKHIKSEALEMKLYYFPRVDDLGFLEFLLEYLEDLMKNQDILLKEEINALHVEVSSLLSLGVFKNPEILDKKSLNDIMNLAYQAEYIIDLYLVSSPRDLGLISFLSKILQQLQNIRGDVTWNSSRLCQSLPAQDAAVETSEPQVFGLTTQVSYNDGIVGRQEETKNIMGDLLTGENKLKIVSIIGIAGVGKTTLAMNLYNTPRVAPHFGVRAWCSVSRNYQLKDLWVSLLDQLNDSDESHRNIWDGEKLAHQVWKRLKKRRYLIILDNVWDTRLWKDLKSYLPDDNNGSRILITSRNWEVAGQVESKVNFLQGLSDEHSWELFQKKMLQIECLSDNLLTISEKIVKNCKGLPLAIVIVAGILSSLERTEEKWHQIAASVNSVGLAEREGKCREIIELSYNHLPYHLRSCFLYLGSFPGDQEISVNHLIHLWIGKGLVHDREIDTAEEVATKYAEDLIVKSLVIPAKWRFSGGVETFRLHDLVRDFCIGKEAREKPFSKFLDNNDEMVGLQEETKNIRDDLFYGENKLTVVSIIGMAGLGKTTLALTLYNSPSMISHFDVRARCAISQSYELRALLVSLLNQVSAPDESHRNITDDQDLAGKFCKSLRRRKYLIILDDVWDTKLWMDLQHYLPDDENGSRILITTRNREVADHIGSKVHELHGLSDEHSWELFRRRMLQIECLSDDLLTISKEIVKSCKGLPLSIIIVTGVLSGLHRTEEKWYQIAQNVSSAVLSDRQGECKAILKLSYNHLPYRLRSCFLYLGSFPEDQEISVNRLILLWIGEGLVQDSGTHTAEEVAKSYVEYLVVRNLVIPAKWRSLGGVKTFRLHDLLRDFCLDKAKEEHFFMLLGDEEFGKRNHPLALPDPRRIIMSGSGSLTKWKGDFSFHSVRSMIFKRKLDVFKIKKRIGSWDTLLLRVLVVDEACSQLFSIDNVWENHLQDISCLVHLRYLAFHLDDISSSFKRIEQDSVFTSSLSKLQNLQILILNRRHDVYKVPEFIWDMVKLRHIHIDHASFDVESNRLQSSPVLLENLKSLSRARVSYGDSKWLSKLLGLQRLICLFKTDDLEVDDVTEIDNATELTGDSSMDDTIEVDDDIEVDDATEVRSRMLSFNACLISLKVENQSGLAQRFRSTCQLPKSLQKLTLSSFYLTSNDISKIGQTLTRLEVFKIYSCGVPTGFEWNVENDDFPELKVLKLKDLKISKWIVSEDSFYKLQQIWMEKCACLEKMPIEFGDLPNLRIISVEECPRSVDESVLEIEKEQSNQNNKIRVHISPKLTLVNDGS